MTLHILRIPHSPSSSSGVVLPRVGNALHPQGNGDGVARTAPSPLRAATAAPERQNARFALMPSVEATASVDIRVPHIGKDSYGAIVNLHDRGRTNCQRWAARRRPLSPVTHTVAPIRMLRSFAFVKGDDLKNDYESDGDVTRICIPRKRIGDEVFALIDTKDLAIVASVPGRWYVRCAANGSTKKLYPFTHLNIRARDFRTTFMHRFLTECPEGFVVDHVNHDPLDNRRSNLRIVTHAANLLNRQGINPFNQSSSCPGVYWSKSRRQWAAQIGHEGKNVFLGAFDSENAAIDAVTTVRNELIEKGTRR